MPIDQSNDEWLMSVRLDDRDYVVVHRPRPRRRSRDLRTEPCTICHITLSAYENLQQCAACYAAMRRLVALTPITAVCDLCGEPEPSNPTWMHAAAPKVARDHDHHSGAPRGLLCRRHNLMLGLAHDDADLIRAAADYLDHHRANPTTIAARIEALEPLSDQTRLLFDTPPATPPADPAADPATGRARRPRPRLPVGHRPVRRPRT